MSAPAPRVVQRSMISTLDSAQRLPCLQEGDSYETVEWEQWLGVGLPAGRMVLRKVVVTRATATLLWWRFEDDAAITRTRRVLATLHLPTPASEEEIRILREYEQLASVATDAARKLLDVMGILARGPYYGAEIRPVGPEITDLLTRLDAALQPATTEESKP